MATVSIELPDDLLAALPGASEDPAKAIRLAAAFFWCSRGELSTGWAAQLAGLPYADFLKAAGQHKVDLFQYSAEELTEQIDRGYTLGRQRLADHIPGESRAG
jgi:hypothetical protein